ncbi:hypothetical protein ACOME3_002155 [Neoechinorhynchus agilis]
MSGFLNKLFGNRSGSSSGSSGGSSAPNPQQAAERITELIDLMQKRQVHLEDKIDECVQRARRFGTKNKRQALGALKEKKRLEKQLEQTDGIITTLEYQREAIQNAQSNADILKVMSYAVKAMRSVNQNIDPDKVYDIIDDIAEQHEIASEIANAISNPVAGASRDFDEDELMNELEQLEQEELEKQMMQVGPLPHVPAIATTTTTTATTTTTEQQGTVTSVVKSTVREKNEPEAEEDDDLKQLRMWAS